MIPLARAMRDAFASADPQVARHLASLPERPSCRKGCAACCELLNLITWPEAALIAEELRKHGWVARFLPALLEQAQASSFDGLDQASYWQSRIPCAFLRADRSCAIYDARPGPCRYHFAFSPPELCAERPSGEVRVFDEVPVLAQVIGPVLRAAMKSAGPEMREVAPLPIMVLEALACFGETVPTTITATAWLELHGARVWGYQHESRRAALAR